MHNVHWWPHQCDHGLVPCTKGHALFYHGYQVKLCLSYIIIVYPPISPPLPPPLNNSADSYLYTEDLLHLNEVSKGTTCQVPSQLQGINTPLNAEAWQRCLGNHPDLAYVDYILTGIRSGFRVGFDSKHKLLSKGKRNMQSAYSHPDVVTEQLLKDC